MRNVLLAASESSSRFKTRLGQILLTRFCESAKTINTSGWSRGNPGSCNSVWFYARYLWMKHSSMCVQESHLIFCGSSSCASACSTLLWVEKQKHFLTNGLHANWYWCSAMVASRHYNRPGRWHSSRMSPAV